MQSSGIYTEAPARNAPGLLLIGTSTTSGSWQSRFIVCCLLGFVGNGHGPSHWRRPPRPGVLSSPASSARRKLKGKFNISAIAVAAPLAATASASALDDSRTVGGQGKSGMPSTGAGSVQVLSSPNSEDQGAGGVKGSAQGEGATIGDTTPRDTAPAFLPPLPPQ
jgi:hypothetical protein